MWHGCKTHTEAHGHLQSLRASGTGREWECATHSIGIPVRYTSTFVVEESPEVQGLADHMSAIARLVCVPNGCPPPRCDVNSLRSRGGRGNDVGNEPRSIILHGEDGCDGRGCAWCSPRCALKHAYCLDTWCRWARWWWECTAARPLDRVLSEDGAAGCWPAVCRAVGCVLEVLYVGLAVTISLS